MNKRGDKANKKMRAAAGMLCVCFVLYSASFAFAVETPQPSATEIQQDSFFQEEIIPNKSGMNSITPTSPALDTNNSIHLTTIEEIEKIGRDDGYPLDGQYELMNDIDGQDLPFRPVGSIEEPFTGVFNGNGFKISNLIIDTNDENSGMFVNFSGTLFSLNLQNIKVKAAGSVGTLCSVVSGEADISDVFITGEVILPQETEIGIAGGVAGKIKNAKRIENVAAFVNIPQQSKLTGAFVGENSAQTEVFKGCIWSSMYGQDSALGLDSSVNGADGIAKIETNPTYLALMIGDAGEAVTANADQAGQYGLTFQRFFLEDDSILDISGITNESVQVEPKADIGAGQLIAVYEKTYADNTKDEIQFATPVIVSKDINEPVKLEPVDPVFPTQIEEVKKLDSILPTEIEDKTVEITTWEQFRNIGNTEYDASYTMDADYILGADITADQSEFSPIGTEENPFTGTFDGKTYKIDVSANPQIDTGAKYNGLFGVVRQK